MDELTPTQIAAIRKLQERQCEAFRKTNPKKYETSDIRKMIAEVNELQSTATKQQQPVEEGKTPFELITEWIKGHRLAFSLSTGFALACIFALAIFLRPAPTPAGSIQLAMLPGGQRSGDISLPKYLRLENGAMEIFEGDDRLTGDATLSDDASTNGLTVYDVKLTGTDSDGVKGHIFGTLTLTNAPGVKTISGNADVRGALLDVTFEIEGIATNHFKEPFGP